MAAPDKFSWIEKPHLAAMARPSTLLELVWLRSQGIQILISLTETPLRRDWVNDAGLMAVHVPVTDLTAPTPEQLEHCLGVIRRAKEQKLGVGVHCAAGLGRTGTLLAVWYMEQGLDPATAMAKVRELRPGSIETPEQERAIRAFSKSDQKGNASPPNTETKSSMEKLARRIEDSFSTVAGLMSSKVAAPEFYSKFLEAITHGIECSGGAIWSNTDQKTPELIAERNFDTVRQDKQKHGTQSHDELLRQAARIGKPIVFEPYRTLGTFGGVVAGNPTDYFCLISPIRLETTVWGLLEAWTDQKYDIRMQRTFLNYLVQMAGYLSIYLGRNEANNETN